MHYSSRHSCVRLRCGVAQVEGGKGTACTCMLEALCVHCHPMGIKGHQFARAPGSASSGFKGHPFVDAPGSASWSGA
eukprot:635855-Alexandrium_andersonii.AAC.1